jgi:SET domain-containing protein
VAPVRGKGRGVLAARPIAEDELVERNPVIVIPADEWPSIQCTVVTKFCFVWHEGRDDAALALGLGSLINHSASPNVMARTCLKERVIEFWALRDIDEGEELTIDYNADREIPEPLGFRVYDGRA